MDLVTSSRFVDHLLSCVVNYDGRLEILKFRLTAERGLNSFLKFRSMPQLRSLDAFPIVDGTAPTRRFIKQECVTINAAKIDAASARIKLMAIPPGSLSWLYPAPVLFGIQLLSARSRNKDQKRATSRPMARQKGTVFLITAATDSCSAK